MEDKLYLTLHFSPTADKIKTNMSSILQKKYNQQ